MRADRGQHAVRPGGRRVVHLRRVVARGRRRGARRERGAALDQRPGRAARDRPAGCSCPAARSATCPRWSPPGTRARREGGEPAGPLEGGRHDPGALLDQERLRHHGRRLPRRAGGRRRPADRREPARDPGVHRHRRAVRRGRHRRHHELRHRRRPGVGGGRSAPSSASGSTWTARTAAPGWPRRASGSATTASSGCDSFIVDPHKWLFAPFDCCALIYRDPPARPGRAHPEGRLPRRADRGRRVQPLRLLGRADPAGPRAAVLVQPGHPRHRRLHRGRSSARSR